MINDKKLTCKPRTIMPPDMENGFEKMQGHTHRIYPEFKVRSYYYTWVGKDATNKEAKE